MRSVTPTVSLPRVARRPGGRRRTAPEEGLGHLRVYSVDDESVQLTWRGSGFGPITFGAGPATVEVAVTPAADLRSATNHPWPLDRHHGAPGAAVLSGLPPDTDVAVWAESPGRPRQVVAEVHTLPRPAGALLCRLATLNDIHIGERRFGLVRRFEDHRPLPEGQEPYPLRCARAALREAVAWGADHVTVKGDLTRDSEPSEFRAVGRLLAESGLLADVVLGNHDVRHQVDAAPLLAEYGIDARPIVRHRDLPGIRVILAHTPGPGDKWGQMPPEDADRIARLARAAATPCMLVLHHPPATTPVTLHYPPGIYHDQSNGLMRRLAAANPAAIVVSGHTHRNRVGTAWGIPCIETASTKDYPGQWTGYRVFEGGIVQTARRVAHPPALAWTEAGSRALGGQWGRWTPGTLADRSWALEWPTRRQPLRR